jgi:hypothetical protein
LSAPCANINLAGEKSKLAMQFGDKLAAERLEQTMTHLQLALAIAEETLRRSESQESRNDDYTWASAQGHLLSIATKTQHEALRDLHRRVALLDIKILRKAYHDRGRAQDKAQSLSQARRTYLPMWTEMLRSTRLSYGT